MATYRTMLDTDGRADDQPVYMGIALAGTATSSSEWLVKKLFYAASGTLVQIQELTGAWDDRATLPWS